VPIQGSAQSGDKIGQDEVQEANKVVLMADSGAS
jgi:hypothetical protein